MPGASLCNHPAEATMRKRTLIYSFFLVQLISAVPRLAIASVASSQQPCPGSSARVTGEVLDSTAAAIVGASLSFDINGSTTELHTGRDGRFATACLPEGSYQVMVTAPGFETIKTALSSARPVTVRLKPFVEATIEAATDTGGVDADDIAGSKTLTTNDVKQLADDPDEFARQLQVLAAAAGGAPGQALVTVDGFQNAGRIPPKSAIALVRINPDLFSAEYARPPYQGGRIEIYTKPGQSALHGALFTTQSAAFMNAKDPFATSRAAIGKQRYGFELSGPFKAKVADFALALEHRQIDQFAVVNAVTLDAGGKAIPTVYNVATPQALWEGSARVGVLLNARNNFTGTYTAGVSGLTNVGVGGTSLQETGYSSVQSEHALRFSNLQTVSARFVHESRFGYTWRYRTDVPNSVATSLQVAGAFTGGGAVTGYLAAHERDLEADDNVLYSWGKHNLKAGVQLLNVSLHDSLPTGFNGAYVFGGGAAPALGNSETPNSQIITGLEQYRRALLKLPGGTPAQYNVTVGTAKLTLNQLQTVFYVQDQWKLRPRLQLALGVRWALQTAPTTVGNAGPRLGVAWSPDRKQKTVLHARTGLFFGVLDAQTALTAQRLNGTMQRQLQISNPVFGDPSMSGSAIITSLRAPLPNLSQVPSLQSHLGVEHEFPGHWHAQANVYLVRAWDLVRSRNVNAPINLDPSGPRPTLPNTNLHQYQQSGNLGGNVMFLGIDQHSLRRVQIFAGYIRMSLRGNADTDNFFPQSAGSDRGERARPAWEATHQGLVFSSIQLPRAMALSIQFNAASGVPYNVTTGFDNNGDGVFNDRPFYAGTASTTYKTRFGSLTPVGSGQTVGRNAGTLPWNVHFDANLSRSFALPHRPGKEGQTVALNIRSTNLLNHNNITAVGGVLGSPLFGQGYASDPGRRVEAGLRWAF